MISSKKPHAPRKLRGLIFAASSALTGVALAAPGDLDTTFLPTFLPGGNFNLVNSAVPQTDGSILLAGAFTGVNSTARFASARVSAAGVLDTAYNPYINNETNNILSMLDNTAFYCGAFTGVNPTAPQTARRYVAQFAASGTVTSFNPSIIAGLNTIETIVEAGNGAFLIGSNYGLHRLAANGVLESGSGTFNHYAGSRVRSINVRSDSKVLIGGAFVTPTSAVTKRFLEQVTPLGAFDNAFFSPTLNNEVNAVTLQSDDKILVGGLFSTATNTDVPDSPQDLQPALLRLTGGGTFDSGFRPSFGPTNCQVTCIAVQADGKILAGGNFTTVTSTVSGVPTTLTRKGIVRLNANGTVDPTFDAKINSVNYGVSSIALQGDGKILITGTFQAFNFVLRSNLVRLQNDPATSDLRAVDSTTVRWLRGGSAPETRSVVFEYSTNNVNWTSVSGTVTRIAGGWQVSGGFTPLPASCFLRARAKTTGGLNNGSTGIVTATGTYPILALAFSPAAGADIANGGTTALPPTGIATPRTVPFLAKNIGTGTLYVYSASFSGPNAALFSASNSPASPITGPTGTAPINIQFSPSTTGPKTATLTLTSNDPSLPTYTATVTGEGVTDIEAWRYQYFGVTTSTGDAADGADPDGDGQTNLFEYVAGLVPNDKASRFQQSVDTSSANAKLIFSPRLTGRTYDIETSTTLAAGSWAPATGTTADNLTVRTFTDAAALEPRRFYRVKITKP